MAATEHLEQNRLTDLDVKTDNETKQIDKSVGKGGNMPQQRM